MNVVQTINSEAKGVKMDAGFSMQEAMTNAHHFERVDNVDRFSVEKEVLNATFKTFRHLQSQSHM